MSRLWSVAAFCAVALPLLAEAAPANTPDPLLISNDGLLLEVNARHDLLSGVRQVSGVQRRRHRHRARIGHSGADRRSTAQPTGRG